MGKRARTVSEKSIGRLSLYRRLLNVLQAEGIRHIFSHQLAAMARCSPAQVRRDLMVVGYSGSPARGYEVPRLIESIREFLDSPGGQNVALVGVGNLGRAILAYFKGRRPNLRIVAAFDNDAYKANSVIEGCHCYPTDLLARVVEDHRISLAIVTVPAGAAQGVADALVAAGVRGLLNFAPVRLRIPPHVYVSDLDMTVSLETVAYFARPDAAR